MKKRTRYIKLHKREGTDKSISNQWKNKNHKEKMYLRFNIRAQTINLSM